MVQTKLLLVEGEEDKRVIPQLVEANGVKWGEKKEEWIVEIKPLGSVEKLLDKEEINIQIKTRENLKIIGIILDADDCPADRWQSIRNCLIEIYPDIPQQLPATGLIHPGEVKLGIWMMPDNQQRGMLETFLQVLLPEGGEALWDFSQQSCQQAKAQGACFKDCHSDKAKIHTWLAWQNPPGRQIHQAIMERILSPASPQAAVFMQWFRKLFEV
ncbi:DUF3226 domain-containing protein [Candidatus Electronema sp. PJ]|uniref:DUF3226 domain-containing protein n=1 Tax=Candidatus Electronema sp. PJ TaxID=3401572 RepID=UPI003AA82ED0